MRIANATTPTRTATDPTGTPEAGQATASTFGKTLPAHVTAAREAHTARQQEMSQLRTRLAAQLHAIDALIATMYLADDDKDTLADLGYADCLVPDPTR